jgi:hypothetical protein
MLLPTCHIFHTQQQWVLHFIHGFSIFCKALTNLFLRHVAPYFLAHATQGFEITCFVTLRVKSFEWQCYWNHATLNFAYANPYSSNTIDLWLLSPTHLSSTLLRTTSNDQLFCSLCFHMVIDHYLCQCQI